MYTRMLDTMKHQSRRTLLTIRQQICQIMHHPKCFAVFTATPKIFHIPVQNEPTERKGKAQTVTTYHLYSPPVVACCENHLWTFPKFSHIPTLSKLSSHSWQVHAVFVWNSIVLTQSEPTEKEHKLASSLRETFSMITQTSMWNLPNNW